MDREKKITIGWLLITINLMIVIVVLLYVVGDAKESCMEYCDAQVALHCEDDLYDTSNYLFDTKGTSPQMRQFPKDADTWSDST